MRIQSRGAWGWAWAGAVVLLTGCGGTKSESRPAAATSGESESSYSSESERTRAMEEQARSATEALEEARASGATGDDAVRAYEQFERERAQVNATGEGAAEEAGAEEPPPQ